MCSSSSEKVSMEEGSGCLLGEVPNGRVTHVAPARISYMHGS